MGRLNLEAMFSSVYDDWCTPERVLERVRRIDVIGLDPFSNPQSIVGARVEWHLSRGQDALRLDWRGYGLVFCNPPYGDALPACMRRMDYFGRDGIEIVTLVPHRTDPAWYHDNIAGVRAKAEWSGRIQHMRGVAETPQLGLFGEALAPVKLHDGPGESAPFPSVLLYWGERVDLFGSAFADVAEIWTRPPQRRRRR